MAGYSPASRIIGFEGWGVDFLNQFQPAMLSFKANIISEHSTFPAHWYSQEASTHVFGIAKLGCLCPKILKT